MNGVSKESGWHHFYYVYKSTNHQKMIEHMIKCGAGILD